MNDLTDEILARYDRLSAEKQALVRAFLDDLLSSQDSPAFAAHSPE